MLRCDKLKTLGAIIAAGMAVSISLAQEDTAANPIVPSPGPRQPTSASLTPAPKRHRAISPEVAAQLAAAAPKFTPAPPKPPAIDEEDQPDLRDTDKPKNGIIRLPKYIVREPRPPMLTERAVNTKKGLEAIAMKRYFTEAYRALNPVGLPFIGSRPEELAMAMYEEDERLRNKSDLTEDARMVTATDKAAGLYVKRQVEDTFRRDGQFDWRPLGR